MKCSISHITFFKMNLLFACQKQQTPCRIVSLVTPGLAGLASRWPWPESQLVGPAWCGKVPTTAPATV